MKRRPGAELLLLHYRVAEADSDSDPRAGPEADRRRVSGRRQMSSAPTPTATSDRRLAARQAGARDAVTEVEAPTPLPSGARGACPRQIDAIAGTEQARSRRQTVGECLSQQWRRRWAHRVQWDGRDASFIERVSSCSEGMVRAIW
eukprot:CAMPEP_0196667626 /NCGR_PEP_ID=MMETSP1086-20130531/65186_1 /TAXON_ID=77921 /ORGANISM="Cyanoptyche  gloeocystis , Strain SAG4.97" /LENGTH=145 /DNA_ID=CAMNT_0042004975 /DNA_START=506 /DNA_END=941 /DNA_ORIENTATION=-